MLSNNFPCHGQQQVSVTLTVNAINFQCSATIGSRHEQFSMTLTVNAINFQCSTTIFHAMVSNKFL
jgi:hypothetical protein